MHPARQLFTVLMCGLQQWKERCVAARMFRHGYVEGQNTGGRVLRSDVLSLLSVINLLVTELRGSVRCSGKGRVGLCWK
jgi:hypothetical protein